MSWRDTNEIDVLNGYRTMPRLKLSTEDKAKMLKELKTVESTIKVRRFPHWVTSTLAAGAGIVAIGAAYFALEPKDSTKKNLPATAPTQTTQPNQTQVTQTKPKKLEAATSRLQKVTDEFGPKAQQLHDLLTHTVGVLDAWAYGKSENPGEGDYSFAVQPLSGGVYPPGIEPYLQADYDKFKKLFSKEFNEMPYNASGRDDWDILESIDHAYQQAIHYYAADKYWKLDTYLEAKPGNNTEAAQAANTLREWNDLLFGGRIQLSDVPRVNSGN